MDSIQKTLLEQVAGIHEVPQGAYSLRINGNLYGKNVRLILGEYLRSEQCFASEEALKKQIFSDVEKIRCWVKDKLK